MKNNKNNKKRAESIVDELLAPTNQREYQNVLNKKITEYDNHLIDSWIKFLEYERKEKETKEVLEGVLEKLTKEEDETVDIREVEEIGMRFEMPDLSKYEWKPNEPKITEEDQLEIDLLINNIDVSEELNIANAIIDRETLFEGILGILEEDRDILVSEKIRELLLEEFHHFPIRVQDIEVFYEENEISLEILEEGLFLSSYVLKIKNEVFKKFSAILFIDRTDEGLSLNYKIMDF